MKNFKNEEVRNEEYSVSMFPSVSDDKGNKRSKMVEDLMNLFEEYSKSSYRDKKIKDAEENRKRYDGDRTPKDFPWPNCSNLSLMTEAIVVDNLEPRLVSAVAGRDRDIIEVIPNTANGTQYTREVEQFAEWALAHNIKWQETIPTWIHEVLLDGTGYIFPYYKEETLKRGKRFIGEVPVDGITGERIDDPNLLAMYQQAGLPLSSQMVDEIRQNDIKVFRVINDFAGISEVYGPDLCPDWGDTPTIRQQFVKYEDLVERSEKNGGVYINITEDLKTNASRSRNNSDLPLGSDRDQAQAEEERPDIEILTFYVKYELEKGDRDWCIITIARDSETVIRKQYARDVYYGYTGKPCKRLVVFPDHGKQYGTGVPHKIRHFSAGINDCLNQMLDSGTVQINPWFFYGADAGLQDELDISPGGANPVNGNASSVVFPELGVKAQVYIEFINLITAYLERLVALSSYQSGAEDQVMGQGAGTASGMRMILQEAQIKHTYQAKPIKDQLGEVIKLDMLLYAWYMPTDVDIVLPGGDILRKVNIDALQQDYDFSLRISDSAYNQMMERYEAQELLGIAGQFPFVNQMQLFKDALDAYDKKNPDAYIDPNFLMLVQAVAQNPEIPQVVQQYLEQKLKNLHQQELGAAAQDGVTIGRMKAALTDQTMIEDVTRQAQKQLTKKKVQDSMEMDAALAHRDMVTPKDIEDAKATVRRRLGQQIVEGSI